MNKKVKNSMLSSFLLMAFIVTGFSFSTPTKASTSQAAANASRAYNLYLGAMRSKKTTKKVVKKAPKKAVIKRAAKKVAAKKVVKKRIIAKNK